MINLDYPSNSEDYVHRIGRTGRSQRTGTAYAFFTPANAHKASDLIQVLEEAKQVVNPKLYELSRNPGVYKSKYYLFFSSEFKQKFKRLFTSKNNYFKKCINFIFLFIISNITLIDQEDDMVDAAGVVAADEGPEAAVAVREVLVEVARREIEEDSIVPAVQMIVLINGPEVAVVGLKKIEINCLSLSILNYV